MNLSTIVVINSEDLIDFIKEQEPSIYSDEVRMKVKITRIFLENTTLGDNPKYVKEMTVFIDNIDDLYNNKCNEHLIDNYFQYILIEYLRTTLKLKRLKDYHSHL